MTRELEASKSSKAAKARRNSKKSPQKKQTRPHTADSRGRRSGTAADYASARVVPPHPTTPSPPSSSSTSKKGGKGSSSTIAAAATPFPTGADPAYYAGSKAQSSTSSPRRRPATAPASGRAHRHIKTKEEAEAEAALSRHRHNDDSDISDYYSDPEDPFMNPNALFCQLIAAATSGDSERIRQLLHARELREMIERRPVETPPLATENLLGNTDGALHYCSLGAGRQPATFYLC